MGHQQNIFIFSLSAFLLKLKKCNYKKCNWVSGSPSILYKLVLSPVPIVHTNFQENLLTYSWCPQLSIPWPVATDSDATDKGLVAYRLGFWAERRTKLQRVEACQQSERYNKVCDPRSSWFVIVAERSSVQARPGPPPFHSWRCEQGHRRRWWQAMNQHALTTLGISRHFKIM